MIALEIRIGEGRTRTDISGYRESMASDIAKWEARSDDIREEARRFGIDPDSPQSWLANKEGPVQRSR